jgi:predicted HTH domain antitoxin
MVSVRIHVEEDLIRALHRGDARATEAHLRLLLAAKLVETGELSVGQAAQLCGLTKPELLLTLGSVGVSAIDLSPAELADELRAR